MLDKNLFILDQHLNGYATIFEQSQICNDKNII